MGMQGFNFGIPASFITVCTIGLGGLFVLIAWAKVIHEQVASGRRSVPLSLYTFTVSVLLDLLALVVLSAIPFDLRNREILGVLFPQCVWSLFLIASCVLLIITVARVRKDSGPGRGSVQAGSTIVLVTSVLGFIWFFVG